MGNNIKEIDIFIFLLLTVKSHWDKIKTFKWSDLKGNHDD